jgi:hypothetical protein
MMIQPHASFTDKFRHVAYDVADISLPDNQRVSALLSIWNLIAMSLETAGTALPAAHYLKMAAREKPAAALSLLFRTQAAAVSDALPGRHTIEDYFNRRRLELETVEFALPAIRSEIPVARLCAAIPAVPELHAMAAFAQTRGFTEIGTLLHARARADFKPHLGLG